MSATFVKELIEVYFFVAAIRLGHRPIRVQCVQSFGKRNIMRTRQQVGLMEFDSEDGNTRLCGC
ncbi:hypothetical protein [Chryseobacterium sp. ISL-6]|uniref:hypothetical protein n=1 Tax=Chryseobacterium sp. ISL-6 TaxID=2819143 RepID=UPI001BEB547E|nr:hypothetical protein [Chryseobacterium sp. ISL-6]MBT2621880.1 hypothetical protein [Chryseobacterium sp. ISL-6]